MHQNSPPHFKIATTTITKRKCVNYSPSVFVEAIKFFPRVLVILSTWTYPALLWKPKTLLFSTGFAKFETNSYFFSLRKNRGPVCRFCFELPWGSSVSHAVNLVASPPRDNPAVWLRPPPPVVKTVVLSVLCSMFVWWG